MTTSLCIIFEVKPDKFDKVRERLGNQLPRYCRCIDKTETTSSARLVKKYYECKSRKRTYLVVITGDGKKPQDLASIFNPEEVGKSIVGWASYRVIRDLLTREGFEIVRNSSHIWAEGRTTD